MRRGGQPPDPRDISNRETFGWVLKWVAGRGISLGGAGMKKGARVRGAFLVVVRVVY
jgi:hypothetical protein